jgi:uridine kinase
MDTITVTCGTDTKTIPSGTTVGEILQTTAPLPPNGKTIVAGLVNNELRALSYHLSIDAEVQPVEISSPEGQRVYRRSLCFLLSMATAEVSPEEDLIIGHSLGNGYFCSFSDSTPVSEDLIPQLHAAMHRIVAEDHPILRGVTGYSDALRYFRANRMEGAALLVERHNNSEVGVYRCGTFMDLSHGPLAPRTGILSAWKLEPYQDGFLLLFPTDPDSDTITPGNRSERIFEIYREYRQWGKVLGINSVGQLNKVADSGAVRQFIRINEALQDKKIARIADQIDAAGDEEKVVLVAGPSSSGKTTFTKKLAVQLQVIGHTPLVIELDNYFVPRELTPLDEEGKYDFESLRAIDIEALNTDLLALFAGKEIPLRRFNFKEGKPEFPGETLCLPSGGILLMEGIHGLNPHLTPRIPRQKRFHVYVSALTQLNLDEHNRIATTDNRLIRRLVRDFQFRGADAARTLGMWPSVRRGEERNIFPFQDSADEAFNTALDYELGVLKTIAEPLLRQVKPTDAVYHEVVRLQTFLRNFSAIPAHLVPTDSILREFIGGSGFHY